jgi:hypothetical protein
VVPEEEAVPARLLGGHRQVHQQPRVTERAHAGDPHRAARPLCHAATLARLARAAQRQWLSSQRPW